MDDMLSRAADDVLWMSWEDLMEICRGLARQIEAEYNPDLIIGIARGGVVPAAILSSMLRLDFYPIRLSRRWHDQVVQSRPRIIVPITHDVQNKQVLLVDEMSVTGETLRLASREADKKGARKVKTAVLYTRSGTWRPTWYGLETDALVVQPWDRNVLIGGEFTLRPEYQRMIDSLQDR